MKHDIEIVGGYAVDLWEQVKDFRTSISVFVNACGNPKLSSSRAERKYWIDEAANLIALIDEMREAVEVTAAKVRQLDLEPILEGLNEMLDMVYPAHRDGVSPYSAKLEDMAAYLSLDVERATKELREGYDANRWDQAWLGAPVFDYQGVAGC